jgi:uncharacterized protein YaeQ
LTANFPFASQSVNSSSTVYTFDITLSDTNRNVYENFKLNVAQHPSETIAYLLMRVLAYCLEYREGLELTKGLSDPDLPALWVHDLTGQLTHSIEIGSPSAERLHRASKKGGVIIYTHKDPQVMLANLRGEKIAHAEEIKLYAVDPRFLDLLSQGLGRRNVWELSVQDMCLYLNSGEKSFESALMSYSLGAD